MTTAQVQLIEEIKTRRREEARLLKERVAEIRKQITAASGKWDSVEALRSIRYAK